jgi:L-fuconolactonase
VDAHVHFWDPTVLQYPWLEGLPSLERPFLPSAYAGATAGIALDAMIVVEANCRPDQTLREVELFERIAGNQRGQTPLKFLRNSTGSDPVEFCDETLIQRSLTPLISGIVAFVSLTAPAELDETLDALVARPLVKGARHNIQGEAPGFCTQPSFVDGVRKVGALGLTFDLCATHDQLPDVVQLVRACRDTRFVLDHCGKPAIRDGLLEQWSTHIASLAESANVWCKLSGLLTEASHGDWREADLVPYASHVVEHFGTDRVMYGSDWPVLTLAGAYADWFRFTESFTAAWSDGERRGFYRDNAMNVYRIKGVRVV